ncbi:GRAS family protein [Streptosporangium sp. NPDC001681]|uniref:GRAS family protein n=1 Tax=Streptosporangium sp. NPDC001681 TaxID=3154395 RepID=UPI00331FE75E
MSVHAFDMLCRAVEETDAGRTDTARRWLDKLRDLIAPEKVGDDFLYLLYHDALARRLGTHQDERDNLYLCRFERPQIELFDLVAEHLPVVILAGRIGGALLAGHLAGRDTATLMSVGIGSGGQEAAVLAALASRGQAPGRLTVIGVDPAVGSLHQAERSIRDTRVPLDFHQVPRFAEHMTDEDWELVRRAPRPLVVNAAFALHHLRDTASGADERNTFLAKLRDAEPDGVVLCEPDSDHHRVALPERFHNSWRHFHAVFRLIDALDVSVADRNAMKLFFRREVVDIVGMADDEERYERHEPTETWLARLREAGFRPMPAPAESVSEPIPPAFVRQDPDSVRIGFDGESLLSVIHAVPAHG